MPLRTSIASNLRQPRFGMVDVLQVVTLLMLLLLLWGIGVALFGTKNAGVNSTMVRLVVLFVGGKITGILVNIVRIPAMLGMLAFGILLKNVHFIHLSKSYQKFQSVLREIALMNILVPAGMGLDPIALRRSGLIVFLLALVPPFVEVIVMGIVSHYIMNLPWMWAILLGTLMGPVSPAVIIPCLFELQDRGYGVEKDVHTLIIAATTLDDVVCITGFTVLTGIIFATGTDLLQTIMQGPIAIIGGITFGFIFGLLAQMLPSPYDDFVVTLRTLMVTLGSLVGFVGSHAVGYDGAGSLGVILMSFIACLGWRENWGDEYNPVRYNFGVLWKFFEPIMYTLIGIEVDFEVLSGNVVLLGSISLIIALLARMLTCVLITLKTDLNMKEILFVAICNIPKATVQAILGPVALDMARVSGEQVNMDHATSLVIVCVMSMLITSPIGALLIMQGGPRLLQRAPQNSISTHTLVVNQDMNFAI